MVKLQRRFAYRYKSKTGIRTHYKFQITLPEELVGALEWAEGDEIEPRLDMGAKCVILKKPDKKGGKGD